MLVWFTVQRRLIDAIGLADGVLIQILRREAFFTHHRGRCRDVLGRLREADQHVFTGLATIQLADPVVQAIGIRLAVEHVLIEQGDKAGVIDVAVLLLKLVRIDEGGRQIGQRRTIFKLFAPVEIARLIRVAIEAGRVQPRNLGTDIPKQDTVTAIEVVIASLTMELVGTIEAVENVVATPTEQGV